MSLHVGFSGELLMSTKTILIVEDQMVIALDIRNMLAERGYSVIGVVSNGEDAISEAREKKPDCVLMDIFLEGEMDGITAAETITMSLDIPIVYLTAHSDEKTLHRMRGGEPYGYIQKPINVIELYIMVEITIYRHAMEKKLRKSEELYRSIFEGSVDGIVFFESTGRIVDCNLSFSGMLGYETEELRGLDYFAITPFKWHRMEQEDIINGQVVRSGFSGTYQKEFFTRDGIVFPVEINTYLLSGRYADDGLMWSVVRNITDRKRMESQLLQAEKMEAIGNLASGLAHDFNNVLGGVVGSISLMEIILQEENLKNWSKMKDLMNIVRMSAHRASGMIKQLLSIARKQDLHLAPVDLNGSLEAVLKICRSSFSKSIIIESELPEEPLYIDADSGQIEQVLLNLCVNGSQAMTIMREDREAEGGTLSVCAERIHVGDAFPPGLPVTAARGDYARVTIRDTGVGMSDNVKNRIFDPFFTTKEKFGGSGLGLAMVYNIVHQHNGYIDVETHAGVGSSIYIYFPLSAEQKNRKKEVEESVGLVAGTGTILLVDDESTILFVIGEMLEKCGYKVLTADKGEQGVELFKQHAGEIRGVIIDMSMPGLSGLDVFKKLLIIRSDVRVLIHSGFSQDERIALAMDLGAAGFIKKPYTISELSEKVSKLL